MADYIGYPSFIFDTEQLDNFYEYVRQIFNTTFKL